MKNAFRTLIHENFPHSITCMLPYGRQYVIIAAYEVLDKYGAEHKKKDASTILSEISVYGNTSLFLIAANECGSGTQLTVTMLKAKESLSENGICRALNAVSDGISQYLENELGTNNL